MSRESKIINRIIRHQGIAVTIRVRLEIENENTGRVTYSYPNTIHTIAIINEITGFRETWYDYGLAKEADFLGIFKSKDLEYIQVGNRVLFGDNHCEITNYIPRGAINPDSIEVVLERI